MRVRLTRLSKHSRRGHMISTPPRVVTVTDRTGTAHLVTDEALRAAYPGAGRYAAVCGAAVLPGSLSAPIDHWCRGCTGWVFAWQRGLLRGA